MDRFTLLEHTGGGSEKSQGDDWTLQLDGKDLFYEGWNMLITIGEVRQLVKTLNTLGVCGGWKDTAFNDKIKQNI